MKGYLLLFAICPIAVQGRVGMLRTKRSLSSVPSRVMPVYPLDRFQEYQNLRDEEQKVVEDILEYDKKSWNLPGLNELELLSFWSINQTSLGLDTGVAVAKSTVPTQIDVIQNVLNITDEDVWDCHINHYIDFWWDELVNMSIAIYFETLGWTNESFTIEDWEQPPSEDKEWYELTQEEREAAEYLCYFPELWAGDVAIADWTFQPPEIVIVPGISDSTDENTTTAPIPVRPSIEYWNLPIARLTVWIELTPEQQKHATTLGYNQTTWDVPGTAKVETSYIRWETLTPGNQSAAEALGIDKFYWDCLIQHYDNYQWAELEGQGVKIYFDALNWNYASWHGIAKPPSSYNQTYAQLGTGQKMAAKQICYLPEMYHPVGVFGNLSDIDRKQLVQPS